MNERVSKLVYRPDPPANPRREGLRRWSTTMEQGRGEGEREKEGSQRETPPRPLKKRHQFLVRKSRVGKPRREILLLTVREKIGRAQVFEKRRVQIELH